MGPVFGIRADATAESPGPIRRASGRYAWWWFATGAALGCAGVVLAMLTAHSDGLLAGHDRLLGEILAWWMVWAVAVVCIRRAPRRTAVGLVIVVGVAMRVAALSSVAPLSDDLYRYAWDAKVQAAGIDPYRYAPSAPQLAGLRDSWLWPATADCAALNRPAGCTRINRPATHTIYPPLAEVWFTSVGTAGASRLHDLGWELAGMSVDLTVIAVLLVLLRRWGRDPRWAVVYAWSPLAVVEAVQNAHVDTLATLFVLIAVALARRRPGLAAVAVAAATLVKLYPVLVLPALLRRHPWRVATVVGLCGGAAYLPHVLAVGTGVLGYLPGYLQEEQYGDGSRYLLASAVGLHGAAASVAATAIIGGAMFWVARRTRRHDAQPDASMRVLLATALLVATPVQPWYGLSLAALAALAGQLRWLAVSLAAYPLYFAIIPAGPNSGASRLGQAVFAAAALVLLGAWWLDRQRVRPRGAGADLPRTQDGGRCSFRPRALRGWRTATGAPGWWR